MKLHKSSSIDLQQTNDELKLKLMLEAENILDALKGNKNGGDLIGVGALKEKVRILEENLKISDSKLFEMENYVLSAEIRVEAAEAKFSELAELNIELTNELELVKCTNSDLEKELKSSRALSETSQEQQKELYNAIWDMETLIADLKSKAFAAETKGENLEERCLVLAEANSELNIQMRCLQSRNEKLEACLKEATLAKGSRAKEVNHGVKSVADLVLQLALERERIQKKVLSLEKENRILVEERQRSKRSFFEKGFACATLTCCTSNQLKDLVESSTPNESEDTTGESLGSEESLSKQKKGNLNLRFILMVILVPVVSAGAMLTALRHFL